MHTWTAEQVGTFLAPVREDRLYPAWLLLATLGMRRANCWACAGRRGNDQRPHRHPPHPCHGGSAIPPGDASGLFVRQAKRAGLPPIRLHDLRHSVASILLARGVHPKVVSELLGHATIALTLDTYSHVIPSLQQEAASVVAAAVLDPAGMGTEPVSIAQVRAVTSNT
jgi:integrase